MKDDLEEAVSLSRGYRREFGDDFREVYVSVDVIREMLEDGAEDLGLNQTRFVEISVDGRVYEHKVGYKKGVFICWSENKV